MLNRDNILQRVTKIEDRLLVSKVLDKAEISQRDKEFTYSDFLDPHKKSVVEKALSVAKGLNYVLSGGYSGAEREVVIFRPDFIYDENIEYPFKILNVRANSKERLTHRDYLGAVMSLGIRREKIGDIILSDEYCQIVVIEDIAEYIMYNLTKVCNTKVRVSLEDGVRIEDVDSKLKTINTTVASLRIDCVASAGFGISRSKIAELIKAEKVSLNWEIVKSLTKQLNEGDMISIRGKGRLLLDCITGATRKERIRIVLKKFV